MITLNKVDLTLGGEQLFRHLDWQLSEGQRVGLVGPNGAGKSTLLKLMSHRLEPDAGDVGFRSGLSIGYMAQEVPISTQDTPWDIAETAFDRLKKLQTEIEHLSEALSGDDGANHSQILGQLSSKQALWESLGGYQFEVEIASVFSGLGFQKQQLHEPISELSGGWRSRVYLAKTLLSKPSVYLLDEPTNHLDLSALEWLVEYLLAQNTTLVVVSHDRWFLNRMCTHIVELSNHGLYQTKGNFETYLGTLHERSLQLEAYARKHRAEVDKLTRFIERFGSKASKAKQAQSKQKQLERLGEVEQISVAKEHHFSLPSPAPCDRLVLTLKQVEFSYGTKPIFKGVNLPLIRGRRVGITGQNGAGKSTLMGLLAGTLLPTAGGIERSERLKPFLFEQHQIDALPGELSALEVVSESSGPNASIAQIRNVLGGFGLGGESVLKPVSVLSGGEKARVALTKAILRPVNLLLLDEPTNHLDMASKAILEHALVDYEGTLVVISHDRQFLNVVCNEIWHVEADAVESYLGDYEGSLRKRAQESREIGVESTGSSESVVSGNNKIRRRLEAQKRHERKEKLKPLETQVKAIEDKLVALEETLQELELEQLSPAHYEDIERMREVAVAIADCQHQQEAQYEAYSIAVEALEELRESLED